jgi:hypothetical protein
MKLTEKDWRAVAQKATEDAARALRVGGNSDEICYLLTRALDAMKESAAAND